MIANVPAMRPYLEAAAVVLAPVRTGGGMRMKVLQALAAGKATVTTPRGLEGFDVFDPDPPLRTARSGEEIAAAVCELLDNRERRHRLGHEARAFANAIPQSRTLGRATRGGLRRGDRAQAGRRHAYDSMTLPSAPSAAIGRPPTSPASTSK